ncbi:MAG: TrkA family potassium uptake protein [Lachnospiraceae bacterium]|nr:TrkA family potassium uptake protein [Lachnospiraceae bacterium]MDD3796259.1 TrkA family potassium uptake protein [Lachnospiraceae bacterium]
MKSVLLIGLGRFGRHIAMKLGELGHQVMAVDREEEKVDAAMSYVSNGQIGDSTDKEFLRALGVGNFDVCIVAIGDDFQSSMETTAALKELGAELLVVRAARDIHAKFLKMAGADEIVYPEKQQANWTAIRYSSNHILDYMELGDDYAIYEIDVPDRWKGRSIKDLDIRKKYHINIIAVKKDGKMQINVSAEFVFQERDSLLILGSQNDIHRCFHI